MKQNKCLASIWQEVKFNLFFFFLHQGSGVYVCLLFVWGNDIVSAKNVICFPVFPPFFCIGVSKKLKSKYCICKNLSGYFVAWERLKRKSFVMENKWKECQRCLGSIPYHSFYLGASMMLNMSVLSFNEIIVKFYVLPFGLHLNKHCTQKQTLHTLTYRHCIKPQKPRYNSKCITVKWWS